MKKKNCKNCTGCALFRILRKDESADCKYFKRKGVEKRKWK